MTKLLFGDVHIDADARKVAVGGTDVKVGSRAFDLLMALVERRDRVVTKGELLDVVWPDVFVEENNLAAQIKSLRKVLGPNAFSTIPGRGYRFVLPGDAVEMPAAPTAIAPLPIDELVGRERELSDLGEAFEKQRLVSLLGAGGIGKTRLAHELAMRWRENHSEGIAWVDLAALDAPGKVTPAIASACGARLEPGEPRQQLGRALAARSLLILLDNCEHLVEEAAANARILLERSPGLRILTTTQVLLHVPGEHAYRLQGLAIPAAGEPLAAAREYPALKLLEQRARTADSRFRLREENIRPAIALCERLDGSPLALEMAAARIPALGIPALIERLEQRLEILRTATRDAPDRQRTLLATLEWTHALLSPTEQAVLRRLSMFAGSFRFESAIVVATAADEDELDLLDAISGLVEKSLLQLEGSDAPRYRLLETMRRFAAAQLDAHGETKDTEVRHGSAMEKLARSAEAASWHLSDPDWMAAYAPDVPDLEAALQRACTRRDIEVAAATGDTLTRIDYMRDIEYGHEERLALLADLLPEASANARPRILNCLCRFGDVTLPGLDRVELSTQRVEGWKALGRLAAAHNVLAMWHVAELLAAGRYDDAVDALRQAREMDDPAWPPRARVTRMLGEMLLSLYRFDEAQARERCLRLIAHMEQDGLLGGAIRVRSILARLVFVTDHMDEAIRLLEDSMRESKGQHPGHYSNVVATLAAARARRGDLEAARELASLWIEDMWPKASSFPSEHVAFVLARLGHASPAAQLLGLGDAYYGQHKRIRTVVEAWSTDRAAELAVRDLGQAEVDRLRREGATLRREECLGLARAALSSRAFS
jgi:predicted ATPase/DNA-binding winged helix-turn-helix (wHTH) protein